MEHVSIPATAQNIEKSLSTSTGNWLYVGGSGPGNYTKIQDAIDNASDDDTVFVYDDSSPYYENIAITVSIYLIGENMNTTIVKSVDEKIAVFILLADGITFSGLSIQDTFEYHTDGIEVRSDYNLITGNTISVDHGCGIHLWSSSYNKVENNIVRDCTEGIQLGCNFSTLKGSNHNNISFNYLTNTSNGIYISGSFYNIISNNICISNHANGIWMGNSMDNKIMNNTLSRTKKYAGLTAWICYGNTFYRNNFTDNQKGIQIRLGGNNTVIQNNFINNSINAEFRRLPNKEAANKILFEIIKAFSPDDISNYKIIYKNTWNENYWDKKASLYPILGYIDILRFEEFMIPWVNFDRHPAQEPYDIPRMT